MKKLYSKSLCVILLFTIMLSFASCTVRRLKTADTSQYSKYLSKVTHSENYMPPVEQWGNYSSATMTYAHENFVIFDTYTVGLFLSYSEDEYSRQKENILASYVFFEQSDEELSSDCDAVWGGYTIRLVKREYPQETYRTGLLIGIDDSACKICYLFYFDFDLDVLDDLDAYLKEFFYMM